MKKTMRYIAVAALALVGTAMMSCSENDFAGNSPKGKAVTLTTTISLDGSGTRALDADGKKTFAKGEQIALIYQDANDGVQKAVATLEETDIFNEGKSATLTFKLEKAPKGGGDFAMIYPASMAIESIPDGGEFGDCASPNYALLYNQNGKLDSLSTKLDLATCEETFTENATLPGSISLANKLAILELTDITDYKGNDLTSEITKLQITVMGSSTYQVNRTAAAGPIYIALPPCSDNAIAFSTTINGTDYSKTAPSKTLAASTMTPVKLKMQKLVNLYYLTSDYTAQDGDRLYHMLIEKVKISIAAGATVELEDANINVNDDGSARRNDGAYAGITCLGDATIILEGTNKVQAFADDYPGIQAASNHSETDYTLTIQGDGSLEATGGKYAAGIGGGIQFDCGNINIEGGTITAKGGDTGAGIGSGNLRKCGDITIEGGNITAKGNAGAGIGSGQYGTCGDITISGGEIKEATGVHYAAGIGSGYGAECGDITISGGKIELAKGGGEAAGIGSGYYGECGSITIGTGITKVTATRGNNSIYCIGQGNNSTCTSVTFGSDQVYNGDSWSVSLAAGDHQYGGLNLNVNTDNGGEIWTLTPSN